MRKWVGSAIRQPFSFKICFRFGSTLGTHLTPAAQLTLCGFFRGDIPQVDLLNRNLESRGALLSAQPSHGQPATNPMTLSATARCAMCSAEVQRVPAERRDFVRSRRLESVGFENPGGFMTRKLDSQEPLLNTVARKLGQAAGTLANLTHKLTTEQTAAAASQLTSKPESMNPGPAGAGSARRGSDRPGSGRPRSANSGSVQPQKNRAAQQSQGTRKTRAAASGPASRQGTIRTKSKLRRKG